MIKILQGIITHILEINEKIKSLSKERRYKEKPNEILEHGNISTKMDPVYGFSSRLEWTKDRLNVLTDRTIEVTQSEKPRENNFCVSWWVIHCLKDLWD